MCLTGTTCLPVDGCFSENSKCVGLVQSEPHHNLIEHYFVLAILIDDPVCTPDTLCIVATKYFQLNHFFI